MPDSEKKGLLPQIPVSDLLSSVANSVAQAQEVMNAVSLNEEVQLRRSGMHKQGFTAQWYTIPEVAMNIKMAIDINQKGEVQSQLVDGAYQQKYGFNVAGASTLTARIIAVPSESLAGLSLQKEDEVLAKVGDIKEIVARYEKCENPQLDAWFQPFSTRGYAGGFWHVLLTDTSADGEKIVHSSAVIDDRSGEIIQYKLF
jgi:hypothetical protein